MKEGKNRNIKRKMYVSLIIPYILIGMIGTAYLGYMYYRSYESRYYEIVKDKETGLDRIDRNLESCFSDADRMAVEISLNSRLSALEKVNQGDRAVREYDKAMAVRELAAIKNYNSVIHETIVYYESQDFFLTPKSIRSFELLWADYDASGAGAVEGKALLTGLYPEGALVAPGEPGEDLLYIRTISHSAEDSKVNVITRFNVHNMEKTILNDLGDTEEIFIIAADGGQTPVYANGEDSLEVWKSAGESRAAGNRWVVKKSDKTGLTYYKSIGNEEIGESLRYQVATYLGIGACFLLLVWFGYNSVRSNYREIEKLMKKLSVFYKNREDTPDTEIGYMEHAVFYLEDVIRKQGVVVTEDAIKKAVYGMLAEDDEIYTWLVEEKGLFGGGFCILALIERSKQEAEEAKLGLFMLNNVFQEVFESVEYCGVIAASEYYIVVLNWQEDGEASADWVLEKLEHILKFMKQYFEGDVTIGVSSPKGSILKLDDAYREGLIALSESQAIGKGQVIYYGGLEKRKTRVERDKKWKDRLLNNIKAGNQAQVREILQTIYQRDFVESHITIEAGKIIFFELSQILLQISAQSGIAVSLSSEEIFDLSYTAEEYLNRLVEAAEALCRPGMVEKIDEGGGKVLEIQQWIEENYTDCNLSVSLLAEHFHLNMSYLSRAYKEQTGDNLLNTIMTCRVEKAKLLLVQTEDSIPVIAERVGFTNAASFNRAFKKITGITPGKYREVNEK